MDRSHETPTPGEILSEVMDQTDGLTVMMLPLLTIALPGVILLLIAPIALLAGAAAIPAVLIGALLGPPWRNRRGAAAEKRNYRGRNHRDSFGGSARQLGITF